MNVIAEINNHLEILTTQENLKSDGLEFHFFIEQLKGKIDETNPNGGSSDTVPKDQV